MNIIALLAAIMIAVIIVIVVKSVNKSSELFEGPAKKAGRLGERKATNVIQSVLRENDHMFTNVRISYGDKQAELDNVVVNKYGVFIFEVKNYVGKLCGGEDDYEWTKYKITDAGNIYEKAVRNPIKQVKRQTYILAKYLDYYGCRVWIEGRVILLNGSSPVGSLYVLSTAEEIDRTIHTSDKELLSDKKVKTICKLLS